MALSKDDELIPLLTAIRDSWRDPGVGLLKDDELIPLLTGTKSIVAGLPQPPTLPTPPGGTAPDPWYGPKSAVQPSSVDLHIGAILLPGVSEDEPGGVTQPKADHTLRFGHTAVITSQEQLNLPNNIAALGFPPAHLSFRGLLMTNPGHVDPGYVGLMRFTVMNVGREDITLRRGDPIVTLLFFRLSGDTRAGYAQRNGLVGPIPGPTQNEVNRLSLDFLDVSSRADAAATKAVANAEFRAKFWGIFVPGVTAVATIFGALVVGFVSVWQPLNSVRTDVDGMKKVLDLRETKSRLDKLEDMEKLQKRIDELERELKSKAGPKSGGNP